MNTQYLSFSHCRGLKGLLTFKKSNEYFHFLKVLGLRVFLLGWGDSLFGFYLVLGWFSWSFVGGASSLLLDCNFLFSYICTFLLNIKYLSHKKVSTIKFSSLRSMFENGTASCSRIIVIVNFVTNCKPKNYFHQQPE